MIQNADMELFASTFSMTDCEHVIIEDGSRIYPSTHKFTLGDFSWFSASADSDRTNMRRAGGKSGRNVLRRVIAGGKAKVLESP